EAHPEDRGRKEFCLVIDDGWSWSSTLPRARACAVRSRKASNSSKSARPSGGHSLDETAAPSFCVKWLTSRSAYSGSGNAAGDGNVQLRWPRPQRRSRQGYDDSPRCTPGFTVVVLFLTVLFLLCFPL